MQPGNDSNPLIDQAPIKLQRKIKLIAHKQDLLDSGKLSQVQFIYK